MVQSVNMDIKLILPSCEYAQQIEEFRSKFENEISDIAGAKIAGGGSLGDGICVNEWIAQSEDYRNGRNLPEGFVSATQFLAVRPSDNKLVGVFAIRHELTPHLERIGGHIGYSVSPDVRRKGYATQMLRLGLLECEKLGIERVRITCVKENIASAGVIKKCGGVDDGEAEFDGKTFNRFWIYMGDENASNV